MKAPTMNDHAKPAKDTKPDVKDEPDYDDLPRGEFNALWEVAIALGILLAVLGALFAMS
jgi:hypothetical protein